MYMSLYLCHLPGIDIYRHRHAYAMMYDVDAIDAMPAQDMSIKRMSIQAKAIYCHKAIFIEDHRRVRYVVDVLHVQDDLCIVYRSRSVNWRQDKKIASRSTADQPTAMPPLLPAFPVPAPPPMPAFNMLAHSAHSFRCLDVRGYLFIAARRQTPFDAIQSYGAYQAQHARPIWPISTFDQMYAISMPTRPTTIIGRYHYIKDSLCTKNISCTISRFNVYERIRQLDAMHDKGHVSYSSTTVRPCCYTYLCRKPYHSRHRHAIRHVHRHLCLPP